jgi:site-specific recombinase XerD
MRSQPRSPKQCAASKAVRTVFSSQYGAAHVYTRRHIHGCPLLSPNENRCSCPKWIYSKPRQGKAAQQAAGTPSFTEACERAQRILKGFDPEIRAARVITEPVPGITIELAVERYVGVLRTRKVTEDYLTGTIQPVFHRRPTYKKGRRRLNTSMLDFLDQANLRAIDPVVRLEQVTGELLEDWAAGWKSNDMTSKGWRTVATGFFRWAMTRGYLGRLPSFGERQRIKAGNRCGYFSDEHYTRLLESLPFYKAERGYMPANYSTRLRAFIELGRWAGMAVADIVRFSPRVNLGANNVLTYRRTKTSQMAVVVLEPAVADRLRAIPPEEGSSAEQPLRLTAMTEKNNRGLWRNRFQKLCDTAGIADIETEVGVLRRAHPHMLRDTCAIDAISRGMRLENVAKMLGHATVEMTQRSYLFWIQKRLDSCIEDQRAALTRVQVPPAPAIEGHARRRTFVH